MSDLFQKRVVSLLAAYHKESGLDARNIPVYNFLLNLYMGKVDVSALHFEVMLGKGKTNVVKEYIAVDEEGNVLGTDELVARHDKKMETAAAARADTVGMPEPPIGTPVRVVNRLERGFGEAFAGQKVQDLDELIAKTQDALKRGMAVHLKVGDDGKTELSELDVSMQAFRQDEYVSRLMRDVFGRGQFKNRGEAVDFVATQYDRLLVGVDDDMIGKLTDADRIEKLARHVSEQKNVVVLKAGTVFYTSRQFRSDRPRTDGQTVELTRLFAWRRDPSPATRRGTKNVSESPQRFSVAVDSDGSLNESDMEEFHGLLDHEEGFATPMDEFHAAKEAKQAEDLMQDMLGGELHFTPEIEEEVREAVGSAAEHGEMQRRRSSGRQSAWGTEQFMDAAPPSVERLSLLKGRMKERQPTSSLSVIPGDGGEQLGAFVSDEEVKRGGQRWVRKKR